MFNILIAMQRILDLLQKSRLQMEENYQGQREIMDKQVAMHQKMLNAMKEMWVDQIIHITTLVKMPTSVIRYKTATQAVVDMTRKKTRDSSPL